MQMLEEGSFRGRGADFLYMLLLGAIAITIIGPFVQVRDAVPCVCFVFFWLSWPSRGIVPQELFVELGSFLHLCTGRLQVYFLGSSLTFMLVYLWGRRNPAVGMNFLGLFYFK